MISSKAVDILARTLYGEARGEYLRRDGGISALMGIANVVMNRVRHQSWFGKTIEDVCLKPYQFSCWNENDPNRPVLLQVQSGKDKVFDTCVEVAKSVSGGSWPDITHGSDHYYAVWLARAPKWAVGKTPCFKVGQHVFFKLHPTERASS